jgi:hypothetical protein
MVVSHISHSYLRRLKLLRCQIQALGKLGLHAKAAQAEMNHLQSSKNI